MNKNKDFLVCHIIFFAFSCLFVFLSISLCYSAYINLVLPVSHPEQLFVLTMMSKMIGRPGSWQRCSPLQIMSPWQLASVEQPGNKSFKKLLLALG